MTVSVNQFRFVQAVGGISDGVVGAVVAKI
jgi:hypothetical protein